MVLKNSGRFHETSSNRIKKKQSLDSVGVQ